MFELVKTLTELIGPTGHEDRVQAWIAERWRAMGMDVRTTPIGNVNARFGGTGPKLLIGAHADEIGFVIKSIDDRGFLWLTSGRGMAEQRPPEPVPLALPAVVLGDHGEVPGTFVTISGHLITRQQRAHADSHGYDWLDFYVDVGARSREEAERMGLHAGCPVINWVETRRNGRNIVGRAMDDRAGLAVMTMMAVRVARAELKYEVWFTSTVQEEIGLIGARSVAGGFDLGIAVEVGLAGDIPLVDSRSITVALGKGPVVIHKDASVVYTPAVTRAVIRAAGGAGIPIQHATFQNFSSDGREWIQQGVPTAMVAFPCRHTHSPNETVQESDLEQLADLLAAFATSGPM